MEVTLSDDFLGNLAQLTRSLGTSSIDLSGIDEIESNETDNATDNNATRESTFGRDVHSGFKNDVKELASIEDMIKEYSELMKKLKKKKDELKVKTIEHMIRYDIDVAQMSDKDKFSLIVVKRKVNPVTKAKLPGRIVDYFIEEEDMNKDKAEKKAKKMVEWIYGKADYVMDKSLRRYRRK